LESRVAAGVILAIGGVTRKLQTICLSIGLHHQRWKEMLGQAEHKSTQDQLTGF
jgi:hypothetical protein